MKRILWVLFASILFLGSCGGGGGGGGGVASLTITGESGEQVSLNGTWLQGCEDKTDGTAQSQIVSYTISGASFLAKVDTYLGVADCSGPVAVIINQVGTTTLGAEVVGFLNSSSVTATKGDMLYSSVIFTPKTAAAVTELNTKKICGFNDWSLDTPREVLGLSCMPDSSRKDLFYIDDTFTPHRQYHGDEDSPLDGDGYPTGLIPTYAERAYPITGESGKQVNLNGTWLQGCEDKVVVPDQSQIVSYTISDGSFLATVDNYLSVADCSGLVDVIMNQVGTATLAEEVSVFLNSSSVTATKGDMLFSSVTFTPKTVAAVTELNTKTVCGFNNWSSDTPKEVLGTSCMPDTSRKDVFYVNDTLTPHRQYHGDEDSLPDVDGYPTELNTIFAERL